jgi:uncharacterized membrane protein YfcA
MSWSDLANGCFELVGGFMILLNCLKLYRDKKVLGVSLLPTLFFTSWGLWNLFYYPHLGQWLSFTGGLLIAAANFVWLYLALYYRWVVRNS